MSSSPQIHPFCIKSSLQSKHTLKPMFGSSIEIWQTVKYNESEKINSAFHKKIRKNPFTSLVQ